MATSSSRTTKSGTRRTTTALRTPPKTTARPAAATRATPAKPREAKSTAKPAAAPTPNVVEPTVTGPVLGKKELLEKVTETSGLKRRDAKAAMEATLAAMGAAIADGGELSLPGFGKLKINRSQEGANGKVFVCKLRQPKPKLAADPETAEPLTAEPDQALESID